MLERDTFEGGSKTSTALGNGVANHDIPLIVPNIVAFVVMTCTILIALDRR